MRGLLQEEPDSKAINAQSGDSREYQLGVALTSCLGVVSAAVAPLLAPAGNFPWFGSLLQVLPRNSSVGGARLLEVTEDLLS